MSAVEIASICNEFDIFALKPIQMSVLGTIETAYKPIAPDGCDSKLQSIRHLK